MFSFDLTEINLLMMAKWGKLHCGAKFKIFGREVQKPVHI